MTKYGNFKSIIIILVSVYKRTESEKREKDVEKHVETIELANCSGICSSGKGGLIKDIKGQHILEKN